MTLKLGEMAPQFEALASNGEKISLSKYRGNYVVLYFYPKDMTPTCTQQACDFRDAYEDFKALDAVIIGVSIDSVVRHEKFITKHELPFLLIADENHEICDLYETWKLKKNFGKEYMGIERSTFLIDKEGRLVKEWRKIRIKGHIENVQKTIEELENPSVN